MKFLPGLVALAATERVLVITAGDTLTLPRVPRVLPRLDDVICGEPLEAGVPLMDGFNNILHIIRTNPKALKFSQVVRIV